MVSAVLLVSAILPLLALATNHATQPCHTGRCRWEHADDYGYGRFDLAGSVSSISDLTPSAGWTILDCDPSATEQDIRLVCHDPSKGCDHLYLNGAHHTIVRLPEEVCGSTAFAFVKDEWVHNDQSIRGHKRHVRRNGAQPVVKGITLSTNYSELDHTRHGEVSFDATGFSGPAPTADNTKCINGLKWDCDDATIPQSFNVTHTGNLYSHSFDCPQQGSTPGYAGDVNVDLTASVNGSMVFGWSLAGTLLHPKQKIEFYFGLNTTIAGTMNLNSNLNGSLSSGKQEFAQIQLIPMTGIPGLLSIGPAFTVYGEADATLSANVDLSVDMTYSLANAKLYFPNTSETTGDFDSTGSGLQLSASPSAAAEGKVSVHLIPSLSMGVEIVKVLNTHVDLGLDASAALDMTLHAGLDAATSTDGSSSAGAEWGGCINATTSLNIDVSADADIPPLYSKDDTMSLWSYTWPLYSNCFNGSAPIDRRAYIDQGDAVMGSYRDRVMNRYMKNATPANGAAGTLPSGCGTIGNSPSLLPVVPKKASSSSSH
ncbi:hypothetical protein C8T65DRAFT_828365 [Cerioporus squamosus]|nr:hypothetical protein C8T65DRAFT_828365 [Cerioporus squamosus]